MGLTSGPNKVRGYCCQLFKLSLDSFMILEKFAIVLSFPSSNDIDEYCSFLNPSKSFNILHISVPDNCQFWFFENFPKSWV